MPKIVNNFIKFIVNYYEWFTRHDTLLNGMQRRVLNRILGTRLLNQFNFVIDMSWVCAKWLDVDDVNSLTRTLYPTKVRVEGRRCDVSSIRLDNALSSKNLLKLIVNRWEKQNSTSVSTIVKELNYLVHGIAFWMWTVFGVV